MYNTLNTTTKSLNFFSSLHNAEVKTIGASSAFFVSTSVLMTNISILKIWAPD